MKPRQPPVRERCQFHQAPTTSLGDVDRAVPRPPTTDPGGGFFTYAARVSSLQGMQDPLPAGSEVCLRALLRAARGRLRRATGCGPGRAAPQDPSWATLSVAQRRLPAGRRAAEGRSARRLDATAA